MFLLKLVTQVSLALRKTTIPSMMMKLSGLQQNQPLNIKKLSVLDVLHIDSIID
jgi:hypothetical protein